jgi:hypothetical protein
MSTPNRSRILKADLMCRIWERFCHPEAKYVFVSVRFPDGRWKDIPVSLRELDKVAEIVAAHRDCDVYATPNGFTRKRRRREFVRWSRMLFADGDDVDLRKVKPEPSVAVESSAGRYVFLWLLTTPPTEELNAALTKANGFDVGGWDAPQVLRLFHGARNYKYRPPEHVRVLWTDGPIYTVAEVIAGMPAVSDRPRRRRPSVAHLNRPGGHAAAIDPHRHAPRDVLRRYRPKRRLYYQSSVMRDTDRSSVWFALGCDLYEAGANRDEIASVIFAMRVFQARVTDRGWSEVTTVRELSGEVDRIMAWVDARRKSQE